MEKLTKNELIEKCQERGYIKCKSKNKTELINFLENKQEDLTQLSKLKLILKCGEKGLKKCKSKTKSELINLLQN